MYVGLMYTSLTTCRSLMDYLFRASFHLSPCEIGPRKRALVASPTDEIRLRVELSDIYPQTVTINLDIDGFDGYSFGNLRIENAESTSLSERIV